MSDANSPAFWRENARLLQVGADELEMTIPVLKRNGLEYTAKSVDMRVADLRKSIRNDLAYAMQLEREARDA